MIHRTILAALLASLAGPVLAAQFAGSAYDQAAGLAAGKSADAAYDGSLVRTAVKAPPAVAAAAGVQVETRSASTLSAERPALVVAAVPEPTDVLSAPNRASPDSGSGRALGGPIGAMVGALAGFAIGVHLSKLLS